MFLNIFQKPGVITYKSKIVAYLALILLGYLLFQKYSEYRNKPAYLKQADIFSSTSDNVETKYTIKIDENKRYKDYNFLEKWIYYFIKDDLPKSTRNKIGSSESTKK